MLEDQIAISCDYSCAPDLAQSMGLSNANEDCVVQPRKYEFASFIHQYSLAGLRSRGRQAVEEIWRSDLSCIMCNRGGDTCGKYYVV